MLIVVAFKGHSIIISISIIISAINCDLIMPQELEGDDLLNCTYLA